MLDFPNKRYRTIYLDPPWPEVGGGVIKRGADRHYEVMSVDEIRSLPIYNIATQDAHIYLWVTNNYLGAGLECLRKWGFEYITTITWVKDKMGLGQYYRGMTEHCLFGVGPLRVPIKVDANGMRCQGVTVIHSPRREHSRKPDEMRQMIEKVSYPPYIELFARRSAPGWDVWGDKVMKDVKGEN